MTCENGDQVILDGCYVTVRVGDVKATHHYTDSWQARRAVSKLEKSPEARLNFFRRIKVTR